MNIIQCCWNAVGSDPQAKGNFASAPIPVKRAWEMAFDVCRSVDMAPTPGTLRPAYRYPVHVPEQSEILLWARAPSSVQDGDCVLVEPLEELGLVSAARALATATRGRIPVWVRNLAPYPIWLKRYQSIATFSACPSDIREMEDLVLKEVSPGVVEVGVGQVSIDCDDETV